MRSGESREEPRRRGDLAIAVLVVIACDSHEPATSAEPAVATGPVASGKLELEMIIQDNGTGLAVDERWVYYQSSKIGGAATFRVPKEVNTQVPPEKIGPYHGDPGGRLIVSDGNDVIWATTDPLSTTKVYLYRKDSGVTDEVDLGVATFALDTVVSGQYVAVLSDGCVGGFVVNRQTLELSRITRAERDEERLPHQVALQGGTIYCSSQSKLWRVPASGGEFEFVGASPIPIRALFDWDGTHFLYISYPSQDHGGLLNPSASPPQSVELGEVKIGFESPCLYSPRHRTLYWLSRYGRSNRLVLYETETWQRMSLDLPDFRSPSTAIAQDDDYFYWAEHGSASNRDTISRTRKLTFAEASQKYFNVEWSPDPVAKAEVEAKIEAIESSSAVSDVQAPTLDGAAGASTAASGL